MTDKLIDIPLPGEPRHTLVLRLRRRDDAADSYQARRTIPMELRKNPRNPYLTKSLKTLDLDAAKYQAIKWERTLFAKIERGENLHSLPFETIANNYIKDAWKRSVMLDNDGDPLVTKSNIIRDETVIGRYLIPFFKKTDIQEITQRSCDRFLDWRLDYYISGPGQYEQEISFVRDGKKLKRPAVKNFRPAPSTINKDAVAFNKIMHFAAKHFDVSHIFECKIKVPKVKSFKARRRPRFMEEELVLLTNSQLERCVMSSGRNSHCRHTLWGFSELILGTGIRVSEALWLQFKHLEFRSYSEKRQAEWAAKPDTWDDGGITAYKHSELPTIQGRQQQFRIRIANDNLGLKHPDHARLVIPTFYYSEVLFQHLAILAGRISIIAGDKIEDPFDLSPEQFLFINYDGSRTKSLRSGFESLLRATKSDAFPDGLLKRDGKNRTLTSLRHTYASKQIEAGATANGLGFLADNLGTSAEMIRKHYGQALHELQADELQKY